MLAFLNQVRKPTLDLPLDVRRKMWFKPFMQSYLVVFIGYLTMYLISKNFNIAQNDMISTYGLSMTQLGMIGLGFSITYGVGKTLVSYYADGKNTKQFLPFMLILSRAPAVRAVTPPSPNGRRVVSAGPSSVSGTFLTTLVVQAQQVWRCSAQITCSMVMSSACLFSRRLSR